MKFDLAGLLEHATIPALWIAWAAYWWATSFDVKATTRREHALSRWLHLGPLVIAGAMIGLPRTGVAWLDARFVPQAEWTFSAGAVLAATGLLFAVWARRHIGGNWSAIVTLKQDHELVTSGPYSLVRHPIYTGLLCAFAGSALARGEWRGILAIAIVYLALSRKYRLEERWMSERFQGAYEVYRRRVKAIVPFLF